MALSSLVLFLLRSVEEAEQPDPLRDFADNPDADHLVSLLLYLFRTLEQQDRDAHEVGIFLKCYSVKKNGHFEDVSTIEQLLSKLIFIARLTIFHAITVDAADEEESLELVHTE